MPNREGKQVYVGQLPRSMNSGRVHDIRRTSMDTRLRVLSALMASRSLFGFDPERENGTQLVRHRWARLWQALGG